jgi:NADPH2:quinone reductase
MPFAIVQAELGGPEVLHWAEVEVGGPGPGEVRLKHTAVGVNFIDVYHRRGRYAVAELPFIIGAEGVGVIEAVGDGVAGFSAGDRVGYASRTVGSYAEERVVPAAWLTPIPDDIADETAAVLMLKGMTAEYLLHRIHSLRQGESVLVHAAAGGMGVLLCEWAAALGAVVLGTVSTPEKAEIAYARGCEFPILYSETNFAAEARSLTDGRGVDVVYDGVGRSTFLKSCEALAVLGHLVSYGQASGDVAPFDLKLLAKGSLTVSRPNLFHYTGDAGVRAEMAARVWEAVRKGHLRPEVARRLPLKDAAEAHRALEARETIGATVLVV